jgi:hypothetical protein
MPARPRCHLDRHRQYHRRAGDNRYLRSSRVGKGHHDPCSCSSRGAQGSVLGTEPGSAVASSVSGKEASEQASDDDRDDLVELSADVCGCPADAAPIVTQFVTQSGGSALAAQPPKSSQLVGRTHRPWAKRRYCHLLPFVARPAHVWRMITPRPGMRTAVALVDDRD